MTTSWLPRTLVLESDPVARDRCVANTLLKEGATLLSIESFTNILLAKEKGNRCDACFRLASPDHHIKTCSGCRGYWYCNAQCQNLHWDLNHKRICRAYASYVASAEHLGLLEHEKLDALLLSHAIARFSLLPSPYEPENDSPESIMLSLLPHAVGTIPAPPLCPIKPQPHPNLVNTLYSRFGNNNFVIHSHLSGIGHGIFPAASRLFNHSCVPNAVAKYVLSQGKPVMMQVVALRDIQLGEEICIPYVDPALSETRGKVLQVSYGFKCGCLSCKFMDPILPLPGIPSQEKQLVDLAGQLRDFVGVHTGISSLPTPQIEKLPVALRCVLREDYMTNLSEEFSRTSHEGDYVPALSTGLTLLALYLIVYPPNYPQIGMHLLELSKTAWNMSFSVTDPPDDADQMIKERVQTFLSMARKVLMVYGQEGDAGGPLSELDIVEGLM